MRISDWSSDVCSSDLGDGFRRGRVSTALPTDWKPTPTPPLPLRGRETSSARPPPRMATMPARRLQPDPMATTLLEAALPGLKLRHPGKVRDVSDLPGGAAAPRLLMVPTARPSALAPGRSAPLPGRQ